MARHDRSDSESPVKRRQSPPPPPPRRRDRDRSPPSRHKSSRRSDSPVRPIPSQKSRSFERDKPSGRARSPKVASLLSRSPSPRTKRLVRAQDEREEEKTEERRRGRDKERNGRGGDGGNLKERDKLKSDVRDMCERRSEKDADELPKPKRVHEQSSSSLEHQHREKRESRSHSKDRKKNYDEEKGAGSAEPNGNEDDSVARMKAAEEALAAKKKEQPSFELSGKLADETNRVKGVTLLFNEPPEARKPDIRWRLYVFKAGEMLNEPLYIHRQSCYLFGRERRVADIPTDHPSCSKQHAVIQYRQIEKEQPDGMLKKVTRPYLMDLGSTNGTFINDNRVEPQRYYELIEQDTIKFGNSSREYVILHENSAKGD